MNSLPLLDTREGPSATAAMTMTLRAHNAAEHAGVAGVEVDPDAMATVAHHVGVIAYNRAALLPPQFLVVRDGGAYSRKDAQLPRKVDTPHDALYTWSTDLGEPIPRSAKYPQLREMAAKLDASEFIEMTVNKWDEHTLTRAYASGLLFTYFSQRPVYAADERLRLPEIMGDIADNLRGTTAAKLRMGRQIAALVSNNFIRPAFILHRE